MLEIAHGLLSWLTNKFDQKRFSYTRVEYDASTDMAKVEIKSEKAGWS